MKWLKRIAVLLVVAVIGILVLALSTARKSDRPVGMQVVRVESPSGPIAVAVWYPTATTPRPTTFTGTSLISVAVDAPILGKRLPLVVLSHGNGGGAFGHIDLAMDLASAGFVVAAPTHAGDNFADQSRQSDPALFSQRAGQVRATIDHLLEGWEGADRIDPSRVGAYGMSAGGFAVLTLAGATPRMAAIPEHCAHTPEFACKVLDHVKSPLLRSGDGAGAFAPDPRIKAAVLAAPGLGFTFAGGGLEGVSVPVQLWSGELDETVPYATNVKVIQEGLGALAEAHRVPNAAHLSFLAPCGLLKPPACSDPDGFDRAAAHMAMNKQMLAFFTKHLSVAPASVGQ